MCGMSRKQAYASPYARLSNELLWRRCDFQKHSLDAFNELCAKGLVFDASNLPDFGIKDIVFEPPIGMKDAG